jgi:hypothetical protein
VARATVLPLVVDPVVYNTQIQTDNVLLEGPKSNIKVVSHDIWVVLDIRPYNLLAGLIIAYKVVCKPGEVPLEVLPLHICTAEGQKYRHCGQGEEAGVGLEATATVILVWLYAREEGTLTDDLWEQASVCI